MYGFRIYSNRAVSSHITLVAIEHAVIHSVANRALIYSVQLGFSSKVSLVHVLRYRLSNSKAAARVAADLQCWFTVKFGKKKR